MKYIRFGEGKFVTFWKKWVSEYIFYGVGLRIYILRGRSQNIYSKGGSQNIYSEGWVIE